MCCFLTVLLFLGPRVTLIFMAIFSNAVRIAYDGFLIPCLGFLFLPWTTLAYTVAIAYMGGMESGGIIVVAIGFLFDILSYGGGGFGNRDKLNF